MNERNPQAQSSNERSDAHNARMITLLSDIKAQNATMIKLTQKLIDATDRGTSATKSNTSARFSLFD